MFARSRVALLGDELRRQERRADEGRARAEVAEELRHEVLDARYRAKAANDELALHDAQALLVRVDALLARLAAPATTPK